MWFAVKRENCANFRFLAELLFECRVSDLLLFLLCMMQQNAAGQEKKKKKKSAKGNKNHHCFRSTVQTLEHRRNKRHPLEITGNLMSSIQFHHRYFKKKKFGVTMRSETRTIYSCEQRRSFISVNLSERFILHMLRWKPLEEDSAWLSEAKWGGDEVASDLRKIFDRKA